MVDRAPLDGARLLGVAARRGSLDRARHAGRRLPGSHGADGHDPHRRPRHGAGRDGVARHVSDRERHQRRVERAPRPLRDGRRASPSSGSSSIGARTSSWRGRSSRRSCRSSAARFRRRSSVPFSRRFRQSWARSCSFAISSEHDDPLTLRTVADTVVRRRLLAVPGVSQVTPIGGAERQYQVIAHPDQLRANNISLTELLDAVRGASQNTSAGIYTEGPQEYVLQAIGRVRNPEEIGDSVVALRGARSVLDQGRRRRPRGRRPEARRRIPQRQAGGHRRRPEAARREHDRADGAAGSRARRPAAGAAGRA